MWESHQITAFLDLGKEKALTGFPPTLVWFYLVSSIIPCATTSLPKERRFVMGPARGFAARG